MTNENENTIKEYLNSSVTNPIEGIYKSISGTFYRLAIKRVNDTYLAIVLDAEDKRKWKIGEVKAYLERSSAENIFSIRWYMSDKTPEETIGRFESQTVLKILFPTGAYGAMEELIFLKLYPNNQNEETQKNSAIAVSGSGFFITATGLMATNAHVIQKARKIQVVVPGDLGSTTYHAKVLLSDSKNDVAIIQIEDVNFKGIKALPYSISEQADIGEKTFTIGYPLNDVMGANFKVADGIISAKSGMGDDVRYYQITVPIQPGNSGGPLFNSHGDVIGITSARLDGKAIGVQIENVNYAIKSAYLINLINMLPNIESASGTKEVPARELKDLVKVLKDFVCLIQVIE